MPTPSLEKLKAQKAILAARIQEMEARDKVSERKKDMRRKILVGSYYLHQADTNKRMEALKKELDPYLTRNSDRSLFDLPDIAEPITKKKKIDSTEGSIENSQ
jgi:hypothetical protein